MRNLLCKLFRVRDLLAWIRRQTRAFCELWLIEVDQESRFRAWGLGLRVQGYGGYHVGNS
jgi:hypothetical protein